MNKHFATTTLVLATALISGTAFAADNAPLSRAQVRAEFLQSRAVGNLAPVNELGMLPESSTPSSVTRAEVTAQALDAAKSATPYFANRSADFRPAARNDLSGGRSRPEVKLEAIASVRQHQQEFGG